MVKAVRQSRALLIARNFLGSPAFRVGVGDRDSDFELCILLREEKKFYYVLLVEIRTLYG